ncbi:Txe/YoeB family addiction module toxin [Nocardia cyriacigeorgica]|uniref:Endoribonuclease YoeB n=1 Tax=Nocardia cyriacigeorgica TaxID=135487 RepID=A0A6P1D877_9NOCA|nr:Txe/YoeB family addiction module toxin [Nocardia cyriacigeorgica]NEW38785.1 Txe/YoeB family addiction module toxin [Nocardia cyriacigeorgica]NEW44432.1 Txe/YoeB family addiction module toxin [Nocardia cyriacigeorgica]NEW52818.1 Txe/YoeB family addiction module toxin [Nocardia cyriacigeorgica]NEW56826.1 Txe/YoeB family addiction module toxin [Nocardia cyriacigeorgica]
MKVAFTEEGWDDYTHWTMTDRRVVKRINELIRDITRDPFAGTGKPERLKYLADNAWSRRINHEHRLVYVVVDDTVIVQQARFQY